MDILRPELVWVEGRCYRKTRIIYPEAHDEEIIDDLENFEATDQHTEEVYNDEQGYEAKRYSNAQTQQHLNYDIKKVGHCETKRRIMIENKCSKIEFPRKGVEGPVVVEGSSFGDVECCVRSLLMMVDSARKRQDPTHFVSIPLNSAQIVRNFDQFKQDVLAQVQGRGISADVFQSGCRLHLTIGMLVLANDHERKRAQDILDTVLQNDIRPNLSEGVDGVRLTVAGLEYMNDDPAEVSVLYAKINANDRNETVASLCEAVCVAFESAGYLVRKQADTVKLHATVINKAFARDANLTNDRRKVVNTFDIRGIMEKFGDYDFGEVKLECIHVSQRYAYDTDGYYKATAKIQW